ncbi:hypothetical protein [Roseivirga misakiensis]|uniref:Uncharacterized protein n=1 Tax=Roseivirga misakiensis TaxID=1563681 RepID=A0A1E5SXX7_9BACT|nr:hypothetical protein [Roseivirga misakiensis]OEK03983.1 hypothetical protein BFP71_10825 [Roseivirga misakiensis]
MTLERGFLRPKIILDKYTIATGIMAGFLFSISFYGLLYIAREAFRIMTSWYGGTTLLELSPRENLLYNLFFASIAVIFGLQVCFKFIIENNLNHQSKKLRFRQRQAINDITSLSSIFLFFFAKTGTTLGIMFITIPLQYDIDLMGEFPLFFILIPLSLFMNLWMTMSRTLGRFGLKWMAITFGIVCFTSISLAQINLLDYKTINDNIKSKSVELSNKLVVPRTFYYQRLIERQSRTINIYLVLEDSASNKPRMYWNDAQTEVQFTEVKQQYNIEIENFHETERASVNINLHIDKNVKMKYVGNLKEELRRLGIRKIFYSTAVKNSKYPSQYPYFKRLGIPDLLYPYYPKFENFLDSAKNIDYSKHSIFLPESEYYRLNEVKQSNRIQIDLTYSSIRVNNETINWNKAKDLIKALRMRYNSNFLIILNSTEQTLYNDYIKILDLIFSIDLELKNEFMMLNFDIPYRNKESRWDRYEMDSAYRAADQKYPFHIIQWTNEEKRLVELIKRSKAAKNLN